MPKLNVKISRGAIFDEVAVSYDGGWLAQTIKVHHKDTRIENSWRVGPIPIDDFIGKVNTR